MNLIITYFPSYTAPLLINLTAGLVSCRSSFGGLFEFFFFVYPSPLDPAVFKNCILQNFKLPHCFHNLDDSSLPQKLEVEIHYPDLFGGFEELPRLSLIVSSQNHIACVGL